MLWYTFLHSQMAVCVPRPDKVSVFFLLLTQLEPIHTTVSEYAGTAVAYTCFGQLLFSYTSSWDDYEKTRVYCLVQSTAR